MLTEHLNYVPIQTSEENEWISVYFQNQLL